MSETIITKTCSKCKQTKPLNQFGKNRYNKDRYQYYCKACYNTYHKKYHRSEKRIKWHENYVNSEQYKKLRNIYRHNKRYIECRNEYQQTPQFKDSVRKYRQNKKGKRQAKKDHNKFPERRRARSAVSNAVIANKLPRANTLFCKCGNPARHYHHHLGYEPEHYFDVIPVCFICHKSLHNHYYGSSSRSHCVKPGNCVPPAPGA